MSNHLRKSWAKSGATQALGSSKDRPVANKCSRPYLPKLPYNMVKDQCVPWAREGLSISSFLSWIQDSTWLAMFLSMNPRSQTGKEITRVQRKVLRHAFSSTSTFLTICQVSMCSAYTTETPGRQAPGGCLHRKTEAQGNHSLSGHFLGKTFGSWSQNN